VADAIDWKRRHLDALREMEISERRWRGVEQILRQLVSRLCTVAMGQDARLDAPLQTLSAGARHDADETQLQALYEALTRAVLAVENSAPEPPWSQSSQAQSPQVHDPAPRAAAAAAAVQPAVPAAIRAAVAMLIERLAQGDPRAGELAVLKRDLQAAADEAALASVLLRVGERVATHCALLASERAEAIMTLGQVSEQLSEMVSFLTGSNAERERDHEDRQAMDINLLAQMHILSSEVQVHDDLTALRALVTDRLEAVAQNVREFREREQSRFAADSARSERMHSRLVALEKESRELSRNLDLEKQRSRIDMLTRVANRVSFDERFAEELARWRRFRRPVAVLVWDIDRFKSINDACGHRGGDAVLREVAVALSRGRREVDFFARFGGEEFVSLMVGTELADALSAAEQMRRAVESLRFHFHGTPIQVTVSCGITAIREGDSADTVFDRADAALYKAKNNGRNACIAV